MSRIINFAERFYNSIRYNGFYIILALLFPFIIYKLDAGKEIIVSMTEKEFGLNVGLSVIAFSTLCLSVWCIPTLAIMMFQKFLQWRYPSGGKDEKAENIKLKNCLFNQLVNVYNGIEGASHHCNSNKSASHPHLPVRYFAIAPWGLFIATCLVVFFDKPTMFAGLAAIVAAIALIDWKKPGIVKIFEWLVTKNKNKYSKETFIRRYVLLGSVYTLVILTIILTLKNNTNVDLLKWLLLILNTAFLLGFYSFLLYMENSNLEKYVNKKGEPSGNLSFQISNLNYFVLLTYLMSAIIILYFLEQSGAIEYISPAVVIVTMCTSLIVFFELFITSQLLLTRIVTQPDCNTSHCSLVDFHRTIGFSKAPRVKIYRFAVFILSGVIITLYFFSSKNSHRIRITEVKNNTYISNSVRPLLTDYFQTWYLNRKPGQDSIVYLISGQGGGSRAAAWFYMNMMFQNDKDPNFFDKVFTISTVSGSSTGANMFLATKYFNEPVDSNSIDTVTGNLYGKNYMSSAFYGLLLGDFIESFVDMGKPFPRDRNYHLQKEELSAFNETFNRKDGSQFFESDYLRPYIETPKRHWPLFFVNATIVDFGTRSFFSPVRMDSVSAAVDLYEKFKENNPHNNLPAVACVNQSQAFPILSAYNFIDSAGRLGDGGISENTGCATTLEIYQKLRHYCDISSDMKNVQFVCINITNSNLDTIPEVCYHNASIFNTLAAAANSPFSANQRYAYRNLDRQVRYLQNYNNLHNLRKNRDTVINFSLHSDITTTRTLSKRSVDSLYLIMKEYNFNLPR